MTAHSQSSGLSQPRTNQGFPEKTTGALPVLSGDLQLSFPFASLDFAGRTILSVEDIATKLGWTTRHIRNLIEAGELVAINGAVRPEETRAAPRVPLEAYRAFIFRRMTAPFRREFIATLPRAVRIELIAELKASLAA